MPQASRIASASLRAGLEHGGGVAREVVEALIRKPPARVIYVSCDPATLARDLKALAERFRVAACEAFDMFPQTAHVETVVTLSRLPVFLCSSG